MATDYTKTLNLPKTDFSMRANLPQREPEFLEKWQNDDIYKVVREHNAGKPSFILHDGPPYANGDIHIGTAMNKILKDIIVKYYNMTGWDSPYVPGWDCHGLPIESAIIKQTKLDHKKISVAEFRTKCKDFALDYVDRQRGQFKRLGVVGDWDNPYVTAAPEFEAEQIKIFGKMAEKGYIYKGFKSVYWCPDDETSLAEAEIEYSDDKCESIYVKFKVTDSRGKFASGKFDIDNTYFVIWTTTPWTLPGNLAISVNADIEYAFMKVPNGEIYIVAVDLAENLAKKSGIESYEILGKIKGSELELMEAQHPFLDRKSIVLNGEHVTVDTGTGCVHTAPGHGTDDFNICKKYDDEGKTNIGVVVPVDDRGFMTAEAGQFAGMRYNKANTAILEYLRESGILLASETITHSYPHCWRCKNPIIYRATNQWFASVSAMTNAVTDACEDIKWHPKWGKERMTAMIAERSDWCISRQRNWGVPIPIFYCADCNEYLINNETITAVSDLFRANGSNAWYEMEADEILPKGTKCPKCGCEHFTKETDIMDVWFDSGSSHAGVLDLRPELRSPADIYLEGGDQYRGWFQSSMLTSIASKGIAPYKTIITHGWTVDGEGKAMHKSAGNAVAPDQVISEYGADILRLWVASVDYTNDVRISKEILKQLSEVYRKIRNTSRIILANISDFNPDTDMVAVDELYDIDKWALSKLNGLLENIHESYASYEFHYIYHDVNNFCTVDMSKLYIDITKDRVYVEKTDSKARRSAQTAMYIILDALVKVLTPLLAFTSEEIWNNMPHKSTDNLQSVMLNDIPAYNPDFAYGDLEAKWNRIFDLREDVMKSLEVARESKLIGKSLEAKVTITVSDDELYNTLNEFKDELNVIFIVSQAELIKSGDQIDGMQIDVAVADGEKCDRCWMHSVNGTHTEDGFICERCEKIIGM